MALPNNSDFRYAGQCLVTVISNTFIKCLSILECFKLNFQFFIKLDYKLCISTTKLTKISVKGLTSLNRIIKLIIHLRLANPALNDLRTLL